MNTIKHTIEQATSTGAKTKPKHPLMYEGFILRSIKTAKGYKIGAYSFRTDTHLNPLYNTFEAIKLVIDNLKQ